MKDYPHDEFFKYLFSILEAVKAFLENFMPADVLNRLDLETLTPDDTTYITPELAAIYSDKVYRCMLKKLEGKPLLAAIALLEHKSFRTPYPHFQLNEYRQRIWAIMVQNGEKPVMVLPIILYHGSKKWNKKKLAAYFGDVPEELKPYIGDFDYILVDLSKYTDEQIRKIRFGFLVSGMLTMKHSSDKTWLSEQIKVVFERGDEFLTTAEGIIFIENLFVYYTRISDLSAEELKKKVMENLSKKMPSKTFISTYDRIVMEGVAIGEARGVAIGEARGVAIGEAKSKMKLALEFAENLLLEAPGFPDELIAKMSKAPLNDVKEIRLRLAAEKDNRPKRKPRTPRTPRKPKATKGNSKPG